MRIQVSKLKIFYNKIYQLLPLSFYPIVLWLKYFFAFRKPLSLFKPTSLSEKIQWLKLYDNSDLKTKCADKILVKNYVSEKVPNLKFAKVLKQVNSIDEISLQGLPSSLVIKTNHGCCMNTIIKDKNTLSKNELKHLNSLYSYFVKINYAFYNGLELQYKNVIPKIFIEEYLDNNDICPLNQYEVYCFNGEPLFIVDTSFFQNAQMCYRKKNIAYDLNWNKLDFYLDFKSTFSDTDEKPSFLPQLISYSKELSKDFKFVRVDFYEMNNELYFSELTFTPMSGYLNFFPRKYDYVYGNQLIL